MVPVAAPPAPSSILSELLTLTEGVGDFAIEVIQVLGLDKVEPCFSDTL
jgi:hypothetical protein